MRPGDDEDNSEYHSLGSLRNTLRQEFGNQELICGLGDPGKHK